MSIWILMALMDLLIPLTILGLGWYFWKRAPKEINDVFGYRTTRSMKNKETWEFAHHYAGRFWFVEGWIILAVTVVVFLLLLGKPIETVTKAGGILCIGQGVAMLAALPATEAVLKKNFDGQGRRKE